MLHTEPCEAVKAGMIWQKAGHRSAGTFETKGDHDRAIPDFTKERINSQNADAYANRGSG
jgi:hypothetical protein